MIKIPLTLSSKKSGLDIKKVVATRSEIEDGIAKYYGGGASGNDASMEFSQDAESQRITQMLAKVGGSEEQTPQATPVLPDPVSTTAVPDVDDIDDIDEILSADDAIQPSVIEPMALDDDDLIEADDIDIVQPSGVMAADSIEDGSKAALEPIPSSAPDELGMEDELKTPALGIEAEDLIDDSEDEVALSEPEITKPFVKPAPQPAAPAIVDLIGVSEEESKHAITHGKAHVFERWVGIHSRNRILNAVEVDDTVAEVMAVLYQQEAIAVEVESVA